MKNIHIYFLLFLAYFASSGAVPVGSGFNYQGQLLDNGSPANGSYDMTFKAYTMAVDGIAYEVSPQFFDVQVNEGLFHIENVDFGDALYEGSAYWIEVSVRLNGTEDYTTLSPRQRLNAVPYAVQADFLAAHGAQQGDVLQFDGITWGNQTLDIEPTPWDNNGQNISYDSGNVGIGVNPASALHIKDNDAEVAIIDGGNNMYLTIRENGFNRGYIGSYQSQNNTSDEDFEIGTFNGSAGKMHIVTGSNDPRITVTAAGEVGINQLSPEADFHVSGDTLIGPRGSTATTNAKVDINSTATNSLADPLRVRKNGDIKFYIDSNGGASVGSWNTPPINGLTVEGDTVLNKDVKQPITANGIIKSMVHASCGFDGFFPTIIIKSYNAVNSGTVSISETGNFGECTLTFPYDISQRYYHASPVGIEQDVINMNGVASACRTINSTQLSCYKFNTENGEGLVSEFMLFIY